MVGQILALRAASTLSQGRLLSPVGLLVSGQEEEDSQDLGRVSLEPDSTVVL